jgi:predicted aldo/keto reductase-like oxidoreductase
MAENLFDLNIGKLGFGMMRLPAQGDGFDIEQVKKMVDAFMQNGYTYFDTAYVYRGSERATGEALVERYPRDSFKIATKLNLGTVNSGDELEGCFQKSCERLGVDYVDFYLLHGLGERTANKDEDFGAWDFLNRLKAEGKAKHIGFSYHGSPEKLDAILTKHPEAEFVQIQLNYLDWEDEEVKSKLLYETIRRHGKPVIIMEPVKGGMLAGEDSSLAKVFKAADPNASIASWALRFAASLEGVLVTLSGMSAYAHMEDNINTFKDIKPLTDAEMKLIGEAVAAIKAVPGIPCTECKYCVESCPQKINIPSMIGIYNSYLVYRTTVNMGMRYRFIEGGKASSCEKCKKCEEQCPQNIGISEIIGKVSELFD